MASYLVTGGAGFIGSNITRTLVQRGDRVKVLDDFSSGRLVNLSGIEGMIDIIQGTVTDQATVERAVDGVDFVLHQAAIPSVPRSVKDPLTTDRVNVMGTLCVLEGARRAKVKRVVLAASSSAYGETVELPKLETMAPDPLSPYAVSKLSAEQYARAYTVCFGLETVALRYFNVFGPRQDPASEYAAVIPRFIRCLLDGEPPTVYGDGLQTRDFCFVENAVHANLRACEAFGVAGEVFNIACGKRISLLQLAELLGELVGRKIKPYHAEARIGDIRDSLASVEKAERRLGYKVQVELTEGLQRTIEWYRSPEGRAA
jgi:UDP-glucose 4-epimerase